MLTPSDVDWSFLNPKKFYMWNKAEMSNGVQMTSQYEEFQETLATSEMCRLYSMHKIIHEDKKKKKQIKKQKTKQTQNSQCGRRVLDRFPLSTMWEPSFTHTHTHILRPSNT